MKHDKLFPLLALLLALCARSASAATANVSVINFAFVPATTNINVNDTVLWTWPQNSFDHNVFSDSTPQAWTASDVLSGPATFMNTFTTAGTFPYECTVHGFSGNIKVSGAAATPPAVNITSPAANSVFAAPASVQVAANASATGGTIATVRFLVNGNSIGTSTSSPYTATANGLGSGSYSITAIATDSNGLSATNAVQISVVSPPTVAISSPANGATFTAPATVAITATASGPAPITGVQFLVDGALLANVATAPYTATTASLASGAHTLTAIASDSNGFSATNSIQISVQAPLSLPTVAITSPTNGATFIAPAAVVVTATATNSPAAITNVQFLVDGALLSNVTAAPYTATTASLASGAHTLTAIASDSNGLAATNSVQISVQAPVSLPTVSITSPTNGATFSAPAAILITATATNVSAAITNVQFLVNGSAIADLTAAPFTALATNEAQGSYTLTVIATDSNGAAASNSVQVLVALPVTLWTGPSITFSNAAGSDPTLPSSQDQLTTNDWITRGPTMGIFNAALETNFTAAISPADTEWAFGTLSNYATLSFTNWNTWARLLGQSPTNTVGQAAVVHLIAENTYLALTFTSWGTSSSEFSYVRSTPAGTIIITPISLISPLVVNGQFQFAATGLAPGKTNIVQASSDLSSSANWVSIATNVATTTSLNVTGLSATNSPLLFFRVIQAP